VYDTPLQFSAYEYNLPVAENLPPMSHLLQLAVQQETSPVSYLLLNHNDKFYLDETTGVLYNKATFDYEQQTPRVSPQLQLQVVAKHRKKTPSRRQLTANLDAACLVNIQITDVNDNPPQFEKTVYSTRIQVSPDRQDRKHAFVTKVSAQDVDSETLSYAITTRTDLFSVDNSTGVVYLDQDKFLVLRKLGLVGESGEFSLQLSVSDGMMTAQARLVLFIEMMTSGKDRRRPEFKQPFLNMNIKMDRFSHKSHVRLVNLERNVVGKSTNGQHTFSFNSDEEFVGDFFSLKSDNKLLMLNANRFREMRLAQRTNDSFSLNR